MIAGWYNKVSPRLRRSPRLASCAAVALALGGCSVSFPGPSLLPDDDTTGSIEKPAVLAKGLDGEDQRRAAAAMSAALDPASNGSAVAWVNPSSASQGSFTPVAAPYPRARLTCRAFLADVAVQKGRLQSLQGTACRLAAGEWFIRDVKPWIPS